MVIHAKIGSDLILYMFQFRENRFPRRFTVRGDHTIRTCPPEEEL